MRAADARVRGVPDEIPLLPPDHAIGSITRGTTGVNRLRKCDRWMCHNSRIREALSRAEGAPLAIDLGYGAAPWTTVEMAHRLRHHLSPNLAVVGLEIDPERIFPTQDGVRFEMGGFELSHYHPNLVRAFNVLRQYSVAEVENAWRMMQAQLAPGGVIVEGTCNEVGRRATWVLLDANGPISLTLAWTPGKLATPSEIAERLPKALIHRNVPGEPIHKLLSAADDAWASTAGYSPFGPIDRWRRTLHILHDEGWPIARQGRKIRDCVMTVPWETVAPSSENLHN